jgi:hypothetical protein
MSMSIIHVTQRYEDGREELRVELAAATEMAFRVAVAPQSDYDGLISAICAVIPALLRYDSDLMESADDGGRTRPKELDRTTVRRFVELYGAQIVNESVGLPEFAGVPNEP